MRDVLAEIRRYTKLFWINTGPFNNLTARKFVLNLTRDELAGAMQARGTRRARRSLTDPTRCSIACRRCCFDPSCDAVVTNKTPGAGRDILEASANNLHVGVRMSDVATFSERYGLNSRLVDARWPPRRGGLQDWRHVRPRDPRHRWPSRECRPVSRRRALAASLRALISSTGRARRPIGSRYDIAWVSDQESRVDTINGFVEVYMDPRGVKGAWEGLVYIVNEEKTAKIQTLAGPCAVVRRSHAVRSAIPEERACSASPRRRSKSIVETGDSGPLTPIGINLPNDQAIREQYGSKSVSLFNVNEAYEESTPEGARPEFAWTAEEAARAKKWGAFSQGADNRNPRGHRPRLGPHGRQESRHRIFG